MDNDLRSLMYDTDDQELELKAGHEKRFLDKLDRIESSKPKVRQIGSYKWWSVAASIVVLVAVASLVFIKNQPTTNESMASSEEMIKGPITLGDLSPKLQQVQDLYLTSISLELAEIEITEENETLVASYMSQLKRLDEAYDDLTIELNEIGPNNNTINSLIQNLELQLKLLKELRNEINQIKSTYYDQA